MYVETLNLPQPWYEGLQCGVLRTYINADGWVHQDPVKSVELFPEE